MGLNVSGGTVASSNISSTGQFKKNLCATFGLVGYWDAGIEASWTNGSSTLFDLSGTGNNLTAQGGIAAATFGSALGWNFDADGKYFNGAGCTNAPTKSATIEAWIYPSSSEVTSGDRGTLLLWSGASSIYHSLNKSNRTISSYWYSHNPEGYHEVAGTVTNNAWNYTVGLWDYGQACFHQWIGTTTGQVTGVQGNASAGTNINIGREDSSRQYSGGMAVMRVWNRALLAHEILNNYLAEKARFGL